MKQLKTTIIILALSAIAHYVHAGENMRLGELVHYDTSNSQIPKSFIYTIEADDSGKIWTGSDSGGLGVFNGTAWKIYTAQNTGLPSTRIIHKIAFDHSNKVWIGTDSGLVKYDGTTWTIFTPQNSPMKIYPVRAIAVDRQNNIWFGNGNCCDGGLMMLSGKEWKLFTPDNSILPGRIINDIIVDSSNNIWVATDQGLIRIEENSWKEYDKSNSILPYNSIEILRSDSEGKIWIGQFAPLNFSNTLEGSLLTVMSDGTNLTFNNPSKTGKASNRIIAIACDKRGYLWVSTGVDLNFDYAVSIFNKKKWITFALSRDDTSRPYYIPDITVDKNNNVWFTVGNGIIELKQDTLAIDAMFANTSIKQEFKPIRQQKREMAFYDLLGRKCQKMGDVIKKTNGIILGFDNFRVKKIAIVK